MNALPESALGRAKAALAHYDSFGLLHVPKELRALMGESGESMEYLPDELFDALTDLVRAIEQLEEFDRHRPALAAFGDNLFMFGAPPAWFLGAGAGLAHALKWLAQLPAQEVLGDSERVV